MQSSWKQKLNAPFPAAWGWGKQAIHGSTGSAVFFFQNPASREFRTKVLWHSLMWNLSSKQSYFFLNVGYEDSEEKKRLDWVWGRIRRRQEGTGSSPAGETALRCIHGKARSWALSIGISTNKLKNMQTSKFTQQFRHSWGITENYFENVQ